MKTLRFLVALCLVAGFSVNYGNAQATSVKVIDMPWSIYIDCAGEWVTGTLNMHIVFFENKDGEVTRSQSQPMGSLMIGEISLNAYQATGISRSATKIDPYHWTYVNNFHFVGPGVQFRVHQVVQLVINANGEVTATVDKETVECK
jgi:hypothetical protein